MSAAPTTDPAQAVPEPEAPAEELAAPAPSAWSGVRARWRGRARSSGTLRFVVLPLLAVATALSMGYLARTRLVLGPKLAEVMAREADRRGVDLYVGEMKPVGLTGVRFERVRARAHSGHAGMDARIDAVDVYPDLLASLRSGRPVPARIALEGGHVVLSRGAESTARKASGGAKGGGGSGTVGGIEQLEFVGRDLSVELRAGRAFASTRPLKMRRVEVRIEPSRGLEPRSMSAYGELPDGTPFALSSSDHASGGTEFVLEPSGKARFDKWFKDQLPFAMQAERVTLCAGCGRDAIALDGVEVVLPTFGPGLGVETPRALVEWDGAQASLELTDVAIAEQEADGAQVRMEHAGVSFDTSSGTYHGEVEVRERSGEGSLVVDLTWDSPARQLSGEMTAKGFKAGPLFALLQVDPLLHAGLIDGSVRATADLSADVLDLTVDARAEGAAATLPFITDERVEVESMAVSAEAVVDLTARAVSVTGGMFQLAEVAPLMFDGRVVDARGAYDFDAHVWSKAVDAEALRRALPAQIARPLAGAELAGAFGFDVRVGGHTAYPDALRLDIDFDEHDVTVVRDAPMANVRALAATGAPWVGEGSELLQPSQGDWVELSSLPVHVPNTLLAAEDAAFKRHDGFDFRGLRRAMVHNMKVRRMERGGSTITQQLIKNLFLTRNKTALRKLQEAYLTWRIESELSKERILELYVNIAHWGTDMRGLGPAARHYFKSEPGELTVEQTALLATILPNPVRYGGHIERGFIASSRVTKFEHVMANLRYLGVISRDTYRANMRAAWRGEIGGLKLTVCADDEDAPDGADACVAVASGEL